MTRTSSSSATIHNSLEVENQALIKVCRALNRTTSIDALQELYNALNHQERRPVLDYTKDIAFGFDANALYRIGLNGTRGADAIDYLRTRHNGPVIVPGQAVQEVWNNLLAGVEPQAKQLRKRFDELKESAEAIDQRLGDAGKAVEDALGQLLATHGEWIDPAAEDTFGGTVEALLSVGRCHYAPRSELYDLARLRHETKTPPGFRDGQNNHGDFYLWADFLYGLARSDMTTVGAAVLVTNDAKSDWSRSGVAHPILVAEASVVGGVPFYLWNVQEFHDYVRRVGA